MTTRRGSVLTAFPPNMTMDMFEQKRALGEHERLVSFEDAFAEASKKAAQLADNEILRGLGNGQDGDGNEVEHRGSDPPPLPGQEGKQDSDSSLESLAAGRRGNAAVANTGAQVVKLSKRAPEKWFYQGSIDGEVHGPFSRERMRQWYVAGYFPNPDIKMKTKESAYALMYPFEMFYPVRWYLRGSRVFDRWLDPKNKNLSH